VVPACPGAATVAADALRLLRARGRDHAGAASRGELYEQAARNAAGSVDDDPTDAGGEDVDQDLVCGRRRRLVHLEDLDWLAECPDPGRSHFVAAPYWRRCRCARRRLSLRVTERE
jgi:hypothetical protein